MHQAIAFCVVAYGVVVLAGCATLGAPDPVDEARHQFAEDDYCPVSRVSAQRTAQAADPPPPAVASDPERLAMWQRAAAARNQGDERETFSVSGCGDLVTYACWDYAGARDGQQHRTGAVCNAMPGTAVPAKAAISPRPADSQP